MRTVKEISDLTGISVRTLHYYDEIGLLKPTEKSDAGYRLYDDKALETLQQILFFREFDISLKEIKAVLDNPALERNQILQVQRKMLVTKKERMERLIASIDDILKGENKMDFTIFTKTEVEEMFQTMLEHMPENMRNIAIKEFGSIEQWKKHYMEVVSSEEMQKGYAKVVEWYGGKDKFLSVARTPVSKEVAESYNKRIQLEKKVYYEKEPAGKALLGLLGLALNSEKPVPIGYFKGMELQIQHLPFGNEYHARLAGSGTYSTQLGADVLGNLTRLSNLANGIEPSIEKTRNMQIQLEQQLASAEEEVKRPFPQATELTEKSKRLAVLEGLLNMNDKDIVTDTEPEQQCQTDNRQRGQEER